MHDIESLIRAAKEAREKAYSPYSKFKVGAAVITPSGKIYSGCNIENASYSLTNCAERTAIYKAISEGEHSFVALAVVADTDGPIAPCGACRQVIAEFGIEKIILGNIKGHTQILSLEELLPYAFSKHDF
ncbi:cytidine deaminase [Anaerosinus massiliensis]|uniref:cytidine deaminase n=1 Tax=Massilibacillus massiliensis TaxID=1806837 RepID=UPI000A7B26A9|nr:cytidine deaminase [Massilibacillus massiliensis]